MNYRQRRWIKKKQDQMASQNFHQLMKRLAALRDAEFHRFSKTGTPKRDPKEELQRLKKYCEENNIPMENWPKED